MLCILTKCKDFKAIIVQLKLHLISSINPPGSLFPFFSSLKHIKTLIY